MDEIRKVVGRNIKQICSLKGIRQVDIAKHMGVSEGTVSNWIKGTNKIDIESLAEVCSFLGVSLDQIYGMAPITPEVSLSPEELHLISIWRSLNSYGRCVLMGTADAISGNPDMQKETASKETA